MTVASEKYQQEVLKMDTFSATEYYSISDKPVLSNGHVGFVPYSTSIYMNGVYNGFKGSSHRARIPNYANIYVEICGPSKESDANCIYALDVQRAVFEMEASVSDGKIRVKQTQCAHRYYASAIVNTIRLERNSVNSSGEFKWNQLTNFQMSIFTFMFSRIVSDEVESR